MISFNTLQLHACTCLITVQNSFINWITLNYQIKSEMTDCLDILSVINATTLQMLTFSAFYVKMLRFLQFLSLCHFCCLQYRFFFLSFFSPKISVEFRNLFYILIQWHYLISVWFRNPEGHSGSEEPPHHRGLQVLCVFFCFVFCFFYSEKL